MVRTLLAVLVLTFGWAAGAKPIAKSSAKPHPAFAALNRLAEVVDERWLDRCSTCICASMIMDYLSRPLKDPKKLSKNDVTAERIAELLGEPKRSLSEQHTPSKSKVLGAGDRKRSDSSPGSSRRFWSYPDYRGHYRSYPEVEYYTYPALIRHLYGANPPTSQPFIGLSIRQIRDLLNELDEALDKIECPEKDLKNKREEFLRDLQGQFPGYKLK